MKKGLLLLAVLALSACDVNDADVVSKNLSTASDNFEGLCSKDNSSTATTLGVVCQVGPKEYKKHMLGLSDNVTWFMEQVDGVKTSKYFYRVTFKPSVIIPDIDIR